jgi:hypothetical protein
MGEKPMQAPRPDARHLSRIVALAAWAVLFLIATQSASASVSIGHLGTSTGCAPTNDWVPLTVTSGPSYGVPGNGTITSWSTMANGTPDMFMSMKIYRPAGGTNYTVVGHAGPKILTPGQLNTFPASVTVRPGDMLGVNSLTSGVGCLLASPGDSVLNDFGVANDGDLEDFAAPPFDDYLLDISAVFEPSNAFTVGSITRNKKKGTAILSLDLPNPGELTASGSGAKVARAGQAVTSKLVGAGAVTLSVRAKGKKLRSLNVTGKAKLSLAITYTPANGNPATPSVKVKLRKKV